MSREIWQTLRRSKGCTNIHPDKAALAPVAKFTHAGRALCFFFSAANSSETCAASIVLSSDHWKSVSLLFSRNQTFLLRTILWCCKIESRTSEKERTEAKRQPGDWRCATGIYSRCVPTTALLPCHFFLLPVHLWTSLTSCLHHSYFQDSRWGVHTTIPLRDQGVRPLFLKRTNTTTSTILRG